MEMNGYIDHTLLETDATYDKIETLCAEAKEYDFTGMYVDSYWVSAYVGLLKGTDVEVCTMVGLPLGAMSTEAKAFETAAAIADDTREVDMVLSIGEVEAGYYGAVHVGVKAVVGTAEGNCIKVVLGNYLLTKEEIVEACELCVEADVAFVKTSTELSTSGTTPEGVRLIKDTMKGRCLVKAARGIHCYEDMEKMVEVGADYIGTSTSVKLIQKETNDGGY